MDEVNEEIEEAEKHYQPLLGNLREMGTKNGILVNVVEMKGHPAEALIKYAQEQKWTLSLSVRGMRAVSKNYSSVA